jgi:PleD family two-component response regulator
MAKSGSRRRRANERFQQRVVALAEQLLPDLVELIDGDTEARETADGELERLARSAEAVGLSRLSEVVTGLVGWSGTGRQAAVQMGIALRGQRPRSRFAPIHVVAPGRMATLLRRQGTWTAEPLVFSPDLEALQEAASANTPAAVVVPHVMLEHLAELATWGAPTFVYGPQSDWKLQGRSVQAGAAGFLPENFELSDLLRRTRAHHDASSTGPRQVFLLGDEGPGRAALAQGLEAHGASVVSSNVPLAVVPALDQVVPHAMVLSTPVGGRCMRSVLSLARAHVRGNLPIIVIGDEDVEGWIEAGADEVLSSATAPAVLARRVAARCVLHARRSIAVDPVTRQPGRMVTLARLDELVAHAHRRLEPLSVAIVEIQDLANIERRWQRSGVVEVRAAVSQTLVRTVRCTDVVGCIDRDAFLVAMRGVYAAEMRGRVNDIQRRFARTARNAHLLRDTILKFGVADTEARVSRLVLRAQADLEAARGAVA